MGFLRAIVLGLLGRYGTELRFPVLFFVVACLLAFNMVLPDPVPFIDELILGLMTAMLASWNAGTVSSLLPRSSSTPRLLRRARVSSRRSLARSAH